MKTSLVADGQEEWCGKNVKRRERRRDYSEVIVVVGAASGTTFVDARIPLGGAGRGQH